MTGEPPGASWIFGYGSLIWRPDLDFLRATPATLAGYTRRFWQGSHDHRGTPDAPGRVVTLIPEDGALCGGMAYLVDENVRAETFERLDFREKNGYERFDVHLSLDDGAAVTGLVYIAPVDNFAYLGEAPLREIALQIRASVGPSGRNIDYLTELADALRGLGYHDDHVFALESLAIQEQDA